MNDDWARPADDTKLATKLKNGKPNSKMATKLKIGDQIEKWRKPIQKWDKPN